MMIALKETHYSSLIYHSEAHECITYGPLQYANHECHSHYKFSQSDNILTSIVLHSTTQVYDGFRIRHRDNTSPLIGSEIVVDYGQQYFTSSAVLCICNNCIAEITHSSSSNSSDADNDADSDYSD
jgi:hypothetical protein